LRQGLEKRQQVGPGAGIEPKRAQQGFTIGMQPLEIDVRIMGHHRGQVWRAAIMEIGRGGCRAAQARHAELAEIAVVCLQMSGSNRGVGP